MQPSETRAAEHDSWQGGRPQQQRVTTGTPPARRLHAGPHATTALLRPQTAAPRPRLRQVRLLDAAVGGPAREAANRHLEVHSRAKGQRAPDRGRRGTGARAGRWPGLLRNKPCAMPSPAKCQPRCCSPHAFPAFFSSRDSTGADAASPRRPMPPSPTWGRAAVPAPAGQPPPPPRLPGPAPARKWVAGSWLGGKLCRATGQVMPRCMAQAPENRHRPECTAQRAAGAPAAATRPPHLVGISCTVKGAAPAEARQTQRLARRRVAIFCQQLPAKGVTSMQQRRL